MTDFEAGDQLPRPDRALIIGLAALSDENYGSLVNGLRAQGLQLYLITEQWGQDREDVARAQTTALGATAVETELEGRCPPLVTIDDLASFLAASPGFESTPTPKAIWRCLLRTARDIAGAKEDKAKGVPCAGNQEQKKRDRLAGFDLAFVADESGESDPAVPLLSLYHLLADVLTHEGFVEASPTLFKSFGPLTKDIFAAFVNDRLRPEVPLPRLAGRGREKLIPLLPESPRTIRRDSKFVDRVKQGDQEVLTVSRDTVYRFGRSLGIAPDRLVHLYRFFEDLARPASKNHDLTTSRTWLNNDVCIIGERVVEGEGRRPVPALRLEAFIELFYKVERDEKLQSQMSVFGPATRNLIRKYLEEVAPYTPPRT